MKKMKKSLLKNIGLFSTALLFTGLGFSQDTVKVIERNTIHDTNIIHDTVVKAVPQVPVHDTVVKLKSEKEKPSLRVGEFGIRYMPTFSSMNLRTYNGDVVEGSATMSHGFGVMLALNLGHNVGLQAEVNYYETSQSYKDRNLDRVVGISYLNIPLMLSLNTDKTMPVNLNVVAGPQFGINVGSSIKTTGGNDNSDSLRAVIAVKQGDVGLAFGAGLEFALNKDHTCRLDLGYRGFYGLVDMNGGSTGNNTYNVVVKASRKTNGAYIGFTFLF
jgi:hypothetical protein